jgi:Ala-tRNA(Pro) deacylase
MSHPSDSRSVYDRLVQFLREAKVEHTVLQHEPVFTSEDSARVRGTTLSSGAKALICKCDEQFVMFVMPADRKLASKKVRQALQKRSLRFGSPEEVLQLTGLRPGSIPPFGSLFQLPTYCDRALQQEPRINFNAGDHAISISMSSQEYERVEQPQFGDFSDPVPPAA